MNIETVDFLEEKDDCFPRENTSRVLLYWFIFRRRLTLQNAVEVLKDGCSTFCYYLIDVFESLLVAEFQSPTRSKS